MVSGIESAEAKLFRASQHLYAIQQSIVAYIGTKPYEIAINSGKETFKVITAPPTSLAVLIGEFIYQLRSSLDHLVFDLIERNHGNVALPLDWEESCCFPLKLRPPKSVPATQGDFVRSLPGISKQAFTFIEAVQPYHAANGGLPLQMLWIAQLSNIDKHRHLNVILTRGSYIQGISTDAGGRFSRDTIDDGGEIKGKSFDHIPSAVRVDASFAPIVTFDECMPGNPDKISLHLILEACLKSVETSVLPELGKFTNKL